MPSELTIKIEGVIPIATTKSAVSFLKSVTARRLLPSDVVFSHISFVGEHQIAFRMEPIRQAGEVFGLVPVANERITVTALYDLVRHMVHCTLELIVTVEKREYRYEYMLTKEEQKMLCEKMESFFRQRVGTDLQSFSFERLTVPVTPG